MKILAVITNLHSVAQMVTAAAKCSGEVDFCMLGGDAASAQSCANIAGITKLLHINPATQIETAEAQTQALLQICCDYDIVLCIADTVGKNFMPRLAALSGRTMLSDVIEICSATTFKRPIYAGNAIEEVEVVGKLCLTIRATAFTETIAETATDNQFSIQEHRLALTWNKSKVINRTLTQSDRPELANADVIVSGGRGLGSKEGFDQILDPLADALGAAIGASRAAVDAEYVPNDYQVGQTGKVVAPRLYIAIGISGAVQHVAGMDSSHCIVAINKDSEAPIFDIADYGLVGDLFILVPELTAKLTRDEKNQS